MSALHEATRRTLILLALLFAYLLAVFWLSDAVPVIVSIPILIVGCVGFMLLSVRIDMEQTQMADRAVTLTESDKQAAREALSFLYYMPLGWKVVMFPWHGLRCRSRARALAIELERGFLAEPTLSMPNGADRS